VTPKKDKKTLLKTNLAPKSNRKKLSSSQPFWEVPGFFLGEIPSIRLIPRFFCVQGFTLRSRFQAIAEGEASNRAVFAGVLLVGGMSWLRNKAFGIAFSGFVSGRSSQTCAV